MYDTITNFYKDIPAYTEKAKYLINKGCDINSVGKFEKTLLNIACDLHMMEFIRFLIDKDADINMPDDWCFTPLMDVCRGFQLNDKSDTQQIIKCIKLLLEKNVDVNAQNHANETALIMLINNDRIDNTFHDVLVELIKRTDCKIKDIFGRTAQDCYNEIQSKNILSFDYQNLFH